MYYWDVPLKDDGGAKNETPRSQKDPKNAPLSRNIESRVKRSMSKLRFSLDSNNGFADNIRKQLNRDGKMTTTTTTIKWVYQLNYAVSQPAN